MKEMFGKGFGFIMGLYVAVKAVNIIDDMLPEKYRTATQNETKTEPDKEVSSEE